jgi:beta-lactamase class A
LLVSYVTGSSSSILGHFVALFVPESKEIAVSEYARKPLSVGQRRQLLKQRRQAAQKKGHQQPQGLHQKGSLSSRPMAKQRIHAAVSQRSAEGLANLRVQQFAQMSRASVAPSSNERPLQSQRRLSAVPMIEAGNRKKGRNLLPPRKPTWVQNILRLSLLGLGISTIAGTAIALLHPEPPSGTLASSKLQAQKNAPDKASGAEGVNAPMPFAVGATLPILNPGKELKDAKVKIQAIAAAQKDLVAGMFFYNPETGVYLDLAGDKAFPAASTIKLPILIAFFQAVDAGQVRLDEMLVMRKDLISSESGVMQYQPVGTKYSALETADQMITISDNTATNMLIDRLGGIAALNQRFQSWGLTQINLRNPLPDLQGTNTVTPKDMSTLMLKIGQGDLLTPRSRDLALDIMRRTVTQTLLPPGLGEGSTIAHKTGDIGTVVGDSGLIGMPNGQRYVATVFVKRPHNDSRAQELIRQISKISYQALSSSSRSAAATPTTASTAQALP